MPFCKPKVTLGGKAFWEILDENAFFVMQRHRTQGSSIEDSISTIRGLWNPFPWPFRVIVARKPWHVIAVAHTEEELLTDWEWLSDSFVPQLIDMNRDSAFKYIWIFFDELSHTAAKHTLTPEEQQQVEQRASLDGGAAANEAAGSNNNTNNNLGNTISSSGDSVSSISSLSTLNMNMTSSKKKTLVSAETLAATNSLGSSQRLGSTMLPAPLTSLLVQSHKIVAHTDLSPVGDRVSFSNNNSVSLNAMLQHRAGHHQHSSAHQNSPISSMTSSSRPGYGHGHGVVGGSSRDTQAPSLTAKSNSTSALELSSSSTSMTANMAKLKHQSQLHRHSFGGSATNSPSTSLFLSSITSNPSACVISLFETGVLQYDDIIEDGFYAVYDERPFRWLPALAVRDMDEKN